MTTGGPEHGESFQIPINELYQLVGDRFEQHQNDFNIGDAAGKGLGVVAALYLFNLVRQLGMYGTLEYIATAWQAGIESIPRVLK